MCSASGVSWMILDYFVPMVVLSAVLLAWQLFTRRGEALNAAPQARGKRETVALRASEATP